jgi:hypothetical protein
MKRWFNHIVLGVALLLGLAGAWTLSDGVSEYVDTSRAFAAVTIDYKPGSYVWLEPDGESARLTLLVVNDAPRAVTVESLDVNLYFGEDFAGANYADFAPISLARGEAREIELTMLITSKSKLPLAGSIEMYLRGTAIFRFAGIARARGLDVSDTIGVVPLPAALGTGR